MTTQPDLRTTIRIEVAPDGLHITCEYVNTLASIPAAIEKLRAAGILDLVQASRPAAPAAKPKAQRVQPGFAADGSPVCPKHDTKLREGKFGLYCPAKDDSAERGFCALRFAD